MRFFPIAAALGSLILTTSAGSAFAQSPATPAYQVEWVYKVKYGHEAEWWNIFQKYQIAVLDREKELGYVTSYKVVRPGLHTSEDFRWTYRIEITYPNYAGSTHEGEVDRQLFPDRAAEAKEDQIRWELTLNHWDLPIHEVDPHKP
jgi:beta-glucosidase/6-phospho-beta-glucosidase/beta-galactosidase